MSALWITVIIVLVIGIVVGNILLLRSSNAKFKSPKPGQPLPKAKKFEDEDDDW